MRSDTDETNPLAAKSAECTKLEKVIYGCMRYSFDEHFQQDHFDFTFDYEPFANDRSNFILLQKVADEDGQEISARDAEDRGIHVHVDLSNSANEVSVKGYNITYDDFETYLSENDIDDDPWPDPQSDVFYSWSDLWQIYDEQNTIEDSSSDAEQNAMAASPREGED